MGSEGDTLDRLNASERELLLLLGRGHTAKSIAALKDLSELAVNERFRSARRKTGIGSSREIARLLVAQESRDDIIGLAAQTTSPPSLPRPDAPRAPAQRWSFLMPAAVLLAAAILAHQTSTPPAPHNQTGHVESFVFTTGTTQPDLAALNAEISNGRRDGSWSMATETALLTAYRARPLFAQDAATLKARCNARLCEVTGLSSLSLDDDPIEAARFATVTSSALGLDLEVAHARTTTDNPQKIVVVDYWRRVD